MTEREELLTRLETAANELADIQEDVADEGHRDVIGWGAHYLRDAIAALRIAGVAQAAVGCDKIATKTEQTYLALLLLPHNVIRARLQPELAACRDAIAFSEDTDAEEIQNRYEAHAEKVRPLLWASSSVPSTNQRCAKCGCETKSEAALVDGKVWCHPCADMVPSTSQSAPAVLNSLPSGESDPVVTPDCAGVDTALIEALRPFAYYFDLNDCEGRADGDALEMPVSDLRAAHNLLKSLGIDTTVPPWASAVTSTDKSGAA